MAVVPPASAVVDAVPLPVGPRPGATRVDFAVGDRVQASVDVGTGNLLVTTTGLTLPGIDRDVQLGLDYNSLLVGSDSPAADGAAGTGWQMRLGADTRLVANDDGSVLYLAPGGRQGLYEPTSAGASSYTSPAGFKNTLVQTSAGWELSDHTSNAMSVFDTAGKLRTIRDRNGQQTTFDYSSSGAQRLQQITSTRGGPGARTVEVNFAYGVLGSLTQTGDDGTVRKVEYGYDDVTGASPLLTSITDPAGRVTNFGYDTADRLTSVTNTAGVQTTFGYDSTNRVTDVVRDMGEIAATTRFAYASDTQTLVADPNTDPTTPVATGPHTTYSLDGTDRVTSATDPLGRTRASSYTPNFDTASTTSGSGATTSFGYAANGGESLTGITSPTGASVSAAYANTGPAQFLPSSSTDAQGNQTSFGYDGVGNQTSATNSTTTAAAEVTYHPDGVVATSTAPGGGTTSYTRDPATHQITAITPPADSSLGTKTLAWDEFGRLASVTDGRGITTSYTYDLLDRVIEIGYSDTTPSVTYTYDTAGNTTSRTDGSGPAANTVDYGHDGLDRLTSRTASTGGGTIAYTYDDAGNLTGTSDAGGTTTYRYDTANQAVSQTTSAGAIIDYAYDADGNRTDTWFDTNPDHTSFAAHTHTDYDDAQRVTRTWTARGSDNTARVFDTSYCHSPHTPGEPCPTGSASSDTGLIQYSTDHLSGARADYSYDAANRLVAVSNFNGHDYAYSYDIVGNRTSLTVDGTLTQQLSFNAGNQITSPGYGYDAAGNRTGDPDAETLVYDAANRMTAKTGTRNSTYTYAGPDATELVARDASGSSTYAYTYGRTDTNGLPLLETFTRNDKQYNIDYTPDGTPIALHLPSGSQHFYALNYQGTTTALIDDTGTTSATYTYTPYGDTLTATGPGHAVGVNFIRHTAGFTDADSGTGWTKHGIRWNDTTTGTWTTQDPLTRLLNPNAGNRYTYANSNPCNNTDPTGRIPTCTKATIGGAIGGAATGALAGAAGAPFTVGASVGVSALAGGLLGGFGAGIACLTVELF